MVERFFRDLSQQAILPGSFGSVAELVDTINLYLAQHNLEPKRYVWHAVGQEVLNKIHRAWKRPPIRPLLKLFKRRYTSTRAAEHDHSSMIQVSKTSHSWMKILIRTCHRRRIMDPSFAMVFFRSRQEARGGRRLDHEVTDRELPSSKDIAGVNMRLTAGSYRNSTGTLPTNGLMCCTETPA